MIIFTKSWETKNRLDPFEYQDYKKKKKKNQDEELKAKLVNSPR